jgi:hypothetical protein
MDEEEKILKKNKRIREEIEKYKDEYKKMMEYGERINDEK